ncbi:MAG: hypothetical protein ACI31S_03285 [Bacilli bacterium]
MSDVVVKDPQAAIEVCETINENNQKLYNAAEVLNRSLQQIESDWESSGADKESYVTELEKQIKNIFQLSETTKKVASAIRYYAESAQETSSKSV